MGNRLRSDGCPALHYDRLAAVRALQRVSELRPLAEQAERELAPLAVPEVEAARRAAGHLASALREAERTLLGQLRGEDVVGPDEGIQQPRG